VTSLRVRLLLGMVTAIVFLLGVFALTVYTSIRRSLLRELDASLATMAQTLLNYVENRGDRIRADVNEADLPELHRASRTYYFQFLLPDGTELVRSRSLEGYPLLPEFHGPAESPEFQSMTLPNGRPGRAVGLEFRPPPEARSRSRAPRAATKPATRPHVAPATRPAAGPGTKKNLAAAGKAKADPAERSGEGKVRKGETKDKKADPSKKVEPHKKPRPPRPQTVTLVAALDIGDLEDHLAWIRWMLAGAGGGIVLLSLGLAGLVVRQGLRPVNHLAGQIADVDEEDLAMRLDVDDLPRELLPVGECLNGLLGRLEAAFARQRCFTADVAHELRTPLAGMRSTLEVALSRARKSEDYREALDDCLAISTRMHAMVDSLLMLARLESGQLAFQMQDIALEELVEECWLPLADKARDRGLSFENRLGGQFTCVSDRRMLSLVMRNLLDNAVEYADAGGRIWIDARYAESVGSDCQPAGRRLVFRVANTGCRLEAADTERVFERMWRGDASRSGAGEHAGLGLALVRRAAVALGGWASADIAEAVFTVTLDLPAEHPPHGDDDRLEDEAHRDDPTGAAEPCISEMAQPRLLSQSGRPVQS